MSTRLTLVPPLVALSALWIAGGCETVQVATDIGTEIAVAHGSIRTNEAESIRRGVSAFTRAAASITPEQEYYIGRAVGATILGKYAVLKNRDLDLYLNKVGQGIAWASDRPETFSGYHFLALDTKEVNAFAAPGGFIFVTRGMLELCETEDDLAAVLAHEVAHVQNEDGLNAIRTDRQAAAWLIAGTEILRHAGDEDMEELAEAFEGTTRGVVDVLVTRGYGQAMEQAADRSAVRMLKRVGYNPAALVNVLERLKGVPSRAGFSQTHPDASARIRDARRLVGTYASPSTPPAHQSRFERRLGTAALQ